MKTCFIGHRHLFFANKWDRVVEAVEKEYERGCRVFTMGMHGDFDELALNVCRILKDRHKDMKIELVSIRLNKIKTDIIDFETFDKQIYTPYDDIETVMYEIEEGHFKNRITMCNRQMIDTCDTVICYVNEKIGQSVAKTAMRYAQKKGLKVINLYREDDYDF